MAAPKSAPEPEPRGRSISVDQWWLNLLRDATSSLRHPQIADLVEPIMGHRPSLSQISRCLAGLVTTVELVDALCDALNLPRPVYFATSRMESLLMERVRRLLMADAAITESQEISIQLSESSPGVNRRRREVRSPSGMTMSNDAPRSTEPGGGPGQGWRRGQGAARTRPSSGAVKRRA